jgi:hypothetical protein
MWRVDFKAKTLRRQRQYPFKSKGPSMAKTKAKALRRQRQRLLEGKDLRFLEGEGLSKAKALRRQRQSPFEGKV